jgi:single-stranded DNA-binding protein
LRKTSDKFRRNFIVSILYSENNHLSLIGKVTSDKTYSHETYGEKFYSFDLEVVRLSENSDIIPITISERLLPEVNLEIGTKLAIDGQFRSYNNYENEKNRLILTVFAKDVVEVKDETEEQDPKATNEIVLIGYLCKKPIYRQTPFGREIADILLAVNRAYNKSDYIPCIAWGRNARFCQNVEVGTEVKITGRIQSRRYEKKQEDGSTQTRVAYEVSVSSMEIVEQDDENKDENQEVNE